MVTHVFNDGSVILGQFSSKSLCVPSYMPSLGEKDQDKADMGFFEFHTDSPPGVDCGSSLSMFVFDFALLIALSLACKA